VKFANASGEVEDAIYDEWKVHIAPSGAIVGMEAAARAYNQAKVLTAFAGTSYYNPQDTSYPSVCIPLPMPTANPLILTTAAHALLPAIHEGIKYARAGIMVTDLRPTGNQKPLEIFENPHDERNIGPLLEDISRRYGRGSIGLGHGGIRGGPDWTMKRGMRSPRYTTHWDELPLVKAS
jgi:DNA polymerase V